MDICAAEMARRGRTTAASCYSFAGAEAVHHITLVANLLQLAMLKQDIPTLDSLHDAAPSGSGINLDVPAFR